MAEQIPTREQEEISIKYLDLFVQNRFNVSDQQYRRLLSECFGRNGIYPFATSSTMPATPKGLNDRRIWVDSYDKQILALQQYMFSRRIPLRGWKWSRGDGMMGFLNSIVSQRCGVSTLDTWNPMDIVAVQSSLENKIKEEISRLVIKGVNNDVNKALLNGIMIKYIKKKVLMPISLKKIGENEKPAFEESDNLKSALSKKKHSFDFTYSAILCDMEWSTHKNEWKNAQEISYTMTQKPSILKEGVVIRVQARAFRAADSREKPQHSLAAGSAAAMLGKSPVGELEKFVTQYGVSKVYSPTEHPQIPAKNKLWTQSQKNYWIALQKKLSGLQINGKNIDFKNPGSYGEGMSPNVVYARDAKGKPTNRKLTGFAAALESATLADERGDTTKNSNSNGRQSGSRLTAKLWGLEWLWRYYQMSRKGVWDAFAYRMIKGAKKELSDSGPFIKISGETGRSSREKKARMQQLINDDKELVPIYNPELRNKKGEIPMIKQIPTNIVGYESDDPTWEKLLDDVGFGEMRGLNENTST